MKLIITFDNHNRDISLSQFEGRLKASGMMPYEVPDNDPEDTAKAIIVDTGSTNSANKERDGTSFANPIDMKPFFARSTRSKTVKGDKTNTHWYMRIPIQPSKKDMLNPVQQTNAQWLNNLHDEDTVNYDELNDHFDPALTNESQFNKFSTPENNPSAPIAYRTVSNKSPANSWITNNIIKTRRQESELNNTSVKHIRVENPNEFNITPNQKRVMTNETKRHLNQHVFDTGYNASITSPEDVLNNIELNNEENENDRSIPEDEDSGPQYEQLSLFNPPTR